VFCQHFAVAIFILPDYAETAVNLWYGSYTPSFLLQQLRRLHRVGAGNIIMLYDGISSEFEEWESQQHAMCKRLVFTSIYVNRDSRKSRQDAKVKTRQTFVKIAKIRQNHGKTLH